MDLSCRSGEDIVHSSAPQPAVSSPNRTMEDSPLDLSIRRGPSYTVPAPSSEQDLEQPFQYSSADIRRSMTLHSQPNCLPFIYSDLYKALASSTATVLPRPEPRFRSNPIISSKTSSPSIPVIPMVSKPILPHSTLPFLPLQALWSSEFAHQAFQPWLPSVASLPTEGTNTFTVEPVEASGPSPTPSSRTPSRSSSARTSQSVPRTNTLDILLGESTDSSRHQRPTSQVTVSTVDITSNSNTSNRKRRSYQSQRPFKKFRFQEPSPADLDSLLSTISNNNNNNNNSEDVPLRKTCATSSIVADIDQKPLISMQQQTKVTDPLKNDLLVSPSERIPQPPMVIVNDREYTNPRMKRTADMTPAEMKTEEYWEKRRKNNEAARRSRQRRRSKAQELEYYMYILQKENEAYTKVLTFLESRRTANPEASHPVHRTQESSQRPSIGAILKIVKEIRLYADRAHQDHIRTGGHHRHATDDSLHSQQSLEDESCSMPASSVDNVSVTSN